MCIALYEKPIAKNCHMGSHRITCHPTKVNAHRHNPGQGGQMVQYSYSATGWHSRNLPE